MIGYPISPLHLPIYERARGGNCPNLISLRNQRVRAFAAEESGAGGRPRRPGLYRETGLQSALQHYSITVRRASWPLPFLTAGASKIRPASARRHGFARRAAAVLASRRGVGYAAGGRRREGCRGANNCRISPQRRQNIRCVGTGERSRGRPGAGASVHLGSGAQRAATTRVSRRRSRAHQRDPNISLQACRKRHTQSFSSSQHPALHRLPRAVRIRPRPLSPCARRPSPLDLQRWRGDAAQRLCPPLCSERRVERQLGQVCECEWGESGGDFGRVSGAIRVKGDTG